MTLSIANTLFNRTVIVNVTKRLHCVLSNVNDNHFKVILEGNIQTLQLRY